MTIDFIDYFWGDKNSGFDVLYHNMKYGLSATRELSEFLREKSNIEEYNSKQINKLTAKLSSGCVNGTIAPIWVILKSSTERLSSLHMQMVQKLSELVKDVTKYAEDVHKKQKVVKDEEAGTLEAVHTMQSSSSAVQKSRDIYLHRLADVERLKKDNNSSKDLEKAEIKLRKLWDDYKAVYEKHIPIKSDFEQKMNVTCKKFQEIEENHIKQMKEFLSTYIELLQINHDMVGQVHLDFKRQYLDMSIDKLLEQFVLSKYTGIEKPDVIDPNGLSCSASDINRLSGIENDPQKIHDLSTIKITSPDMPSRVNDATAGTSTMNELENNVNSPSMLSKLQLTKTNHSLINENEFVPLPKDLPPQPQHITPQYVQSKSRRTTSLLNIFMSNANLGMNRNNFDYLNNLLRVECVVYNNLMVILPNLNGIFTGSRDIRDTTSSEVLSAPTSPSETQNNSNIGRNPLRGSKRMD